MTRRTPTTRRAFTLVEALVAVVAIAIISVGLAAIFASVGDTVQSGRRISAINQYAASIERRIRADLSNITRDGFLVIRNEYAGAANADSADQLIPLSPDAPRTARLRRVDELLFFARGDFVSARGALTPNTDAPRAREARIYYGHGQKQLEGADGFFRPYLDDPNADTELGLGVRSGNPTAIGEANPNVNAGDWTLLRHATLLKAPSIAFDDGSFDSGDAFRKFTDNELQIGQQVAADSIFRSEAFWGEPFDFSNAYLDDFAEYSIRDAEAPPTFPSGIVDIATETLPEIRRRVQGLVVGENGLVSSSGSGTNFPDFWIEAPNVAYGFEGRWPVWRRPQFDGSYTSPAFIYALEFERFDTAPAGTTPPRIIENEDRQSLVHLQHAWMGDALPAASNEITFAAPTPSTTQIPSLTAFYRDLPSGLGGNGQAANATEPASPLFPVRSRMRYENTPPGYNADVFGPALNDTFAADREINSVLLAAARADQQMVTNSQFIPRCTEFIVEWSFGERYTDARLVDIQDPPGNTNELLGELVWYGAPRPIGSGIPLASIRPDAMRPDADDDLEPGETPTADPLDFDEQRLLERHLLADLLVGSVSDQIDLRRSNAPGEEGAIVQFLNGTAAQVPTTFYFGYGDPRAAPVDFVDPTGVRRTGFDLNGDAYPDDIDGDGVYDDVWPWPRLLRITMSFADPIDQTVEDTFQFVVELPRDGDL